MTAKEYQGWTNHATWVVNLWVENDETTYRLRQRINVATPKRCEIFVLNLISSNLKASIYNDLRPEEAWSDVNWEELCEAWNEE